MVWYSTVNPGISSDYERANGKLKRVPKEIQAKRQSLRNMGSLSLPYFLCLYAVKLKEILRQEKRECRKGYRLR